MVTCGRYPPDFEKLHFVGCTTPSQYYFFYNFIRIYIMSVCQFNSYINMASFYGTKANSIALDVTPQNAAFHLELFCLHKEISLNNRLKFENHA